MAIRAWTCPRIHPQKKPHKVVRRCARFTKVPRRSLHVTIYIAVAAAATCNHTRERNDLLGKLFRTNDTVSCTPLPPMQPALGGRGDGIEGYAFRHSTSPTLDHCCYDEPQTHRAQKGFPAAHFQVARLSIIFHFYILLVLKLYKLSIGVGPL